MEIVKEEINSDIAYRILENLGVRTDRTHPDTLPHVMCKTPYLEYRYGSPYHVEIWLWCTHVDKFSNTELGCTKEGILIYSGDTEHINNFLSQFKEVE